MQDGAAVGRHFDRPLAVGVEEVMAPEPDRFALLGQPSQHIHLVAHHVVSGDVELRHAPSPGRSSRPRGRRLMPGVAGRHGRGGAKGGKLEHTDWRAKGEI